jgi:hypothetical protein
MSRSTRYSRIASLFKYLFVSVIVSLIVGLIIAVLSPDTRAEIVPWLIWPAAAGVY